jgi:hypothetical protein
MSTIQRVIDCILNLEPGPQTTSEEFVRAFGFVEVERLHKRLLVLRSGEFGDVDYLLPRENSSEQRLGTVLFKKPIPCTFFEFLSSLTPLGESILKSSVKGRQRGNGFSVKMPDRNFWICFDVTKRDDRIAFSSVTFQVKSC